MYNICIPQFFNYVQKTHVSPLALQVSQMTSLLVLSGSVLKYLIVGYYETSKCKD